MKPSLLIVLCVVTSTLWIACTQKKALSPEDYPVAIAKADSSVVEPNQPVILRGSASYDPGGETLIFHWFQVDTNPESVEYSSNDSKDAFAVRVILPTLGTYGFVLVVENELGLKSAPDTVVVTVNRLPVAKAGPDHFIFTFPSNHGDEVGCCLVRTQ